VRLGGVLDRILQRLQFDFDVSTDCLLDNFETIVEKPLEFHPSHKGLVLLNLSAQILKGILQSSAQNINQVRPALLLCWGLGKTSSPGQAYDHLTDIGSLFMAGLILQKSNYPKGTAPQF